MEKEQAVVGVLHTSPIVETLLRSLEITLKRGKYQSSRELAMKTLNLLDKFVSTCEWKNASELIEWLDATGVTLSRAAPSETAPANVVQRLIKTVQEDFATRKAPPSQGLPVASPLSMDSEAKYDYTEEIPELRSDIQDALRELLFELESSALNIAEDADKHIHPNEVVLTLGKSRTVESFLRRAAKKSSFEVIVSECAPFRHGHDLARSLAKSKIQTTLITDTAIFAMMSRVNKVIIGTHTVLANGGLKAVAGSHLVVLAAKYYNVPVIVLAPLYKLSPGYPRSADIKIQNRFVSPESLVDYAESVHVEKAQIYNPVFDYVPPELITLFIFNIGSHSPSYIYRLLHETYPPINDETVVQE